MDAVSEVKSRLSIEDIVSEYVELKRSGRNFKGLSPFTNEKTASFMVSPEKQIWHDFSSGKGGNIFSFIMEVEGMTFREALEHLARKAGVDLSQYDSRPRPRTDDTKLLYDMHMIATQYYQRELTKAREALQYVRNKRGFDKQTILDFKIGYAPKSGSSLVRLLISKGFTQADIKKAGLGTMRRSGFSDMFVDRLMIPLADAQGRIVAFTARLLSDNPDAPKYLNTPATPIYDKSRLVFGLHLAKETIHKEKFVVVVEGNLDVIASSQAGVKNVVAVSGTALTQYHFKTLRRFTPDIRLCFDQDAAGQAAAERSIVTAQQLGIEASIVTISGAKDPDELIKKDKSLWVEAIQLQSYMIDWLLEKLKQQQDLQTAQGKRHFTDEAATVIARITDPVEREHYIKQLSEETTTSIDSIMSKLEQLDGLKKPKKQIKKTVALESETLRESRLKQQHFLALLYGLRSHKLARRFFDLPDSLLDQEANKIYQYLKTDVELKDSDDYGKMVVLLFEETYQNKDSAELLYQLQSLAHRLVRQYAKQKRQDISKQLDSAEELSEKKQHRLLSEVKTLDELLSRF
jgi:DNA primase